MDVQTESTDPPPSESQSRGKIRKGFKLFGKRKPGNIFSLRSKGDGNNKSPVTRSSTVDGLSPDSEQEQDRENGQEESQGEREQEEEEPLGEDGVLAAAHARASISSAGSAKSLSFLSLLRGGRRGTGDRRVRTVTQPPAGRQRRGLKGLFGNVKFRSKDKEEEAPPSPLLMSSRANSVEIIKDDLVLTPKPQHRSLDSPETESCEPDVSLTPQDSACTSPSETLTPNVSRTNEHVPPLPASEPPLVPGDNSLSCLLADISSLLTFDSITGGGDIMADVEAEWGKASSPVNAGGAEHTASPTSVFSKPSISSPPTSAPVSDAATARPSPAAVPATASTQSFAPLTRTTTASPPVAKPSSIITTLTKSSTLTAHPVKASPDPTRLARSEASPSAATKSTPPPVTTKPSTTPFTLTSFSAPIMSLPSVPIKSTPSSTSVAQTAPPNVVSEPSISPALTCSVGKRESITSVSKPIHVATPAPASIKPPPVTHSPPTPVAFTQPPSAKLDSASSLNQHISAPFRPSLSSAAGEPKTQVTASPPSAVTTKPLFPSPAAPSNGTTVPTPITTSGSVSAALSKPTPTSSPTDMNKNPPSLVIAHNKYPSPTPSVTSSTQACPASVTTPSSVSLDAIPPTTKHIPAPVSSDKMPLAPTPAPAPTPHAVVPTAFPTTLAPAPIPAPQSQEPPVSAKIPDSVSKDPPAQVQVSRSKVSPVIAQIPIHASTDPPAPAQMQVSHSKAPPVLAPTPIFVSKPPPVIAPIPASVSKNPPAPAHLPVSISPDLPAPVRNSVSVSKDPPAQNTVSQSKPPPATSPALCPVTSPPSTPSTPSTPSSPPAAWSSAAPASAKIRASGQASADEQLISPSGTCAPGAQTTPSKTEELHSESRTSLSRESRIPLVKASGLSKIPVVGGGRAGKPPVRDGQHVDDPPTPVLEEERPRFHSHDAVGRDKSSDFQFDAPASKPTQEESPQPPQTKPLAALPRDSKIPVKHGAQSHAASHAPQAKEPSRTKIPVSKVPVRRAGNKAAAAGGNAQMRK